MGVPRRFCVVTAAALLVSAVAHADIGGLWGARNDSETVVLTRRLPPTVHRNGNTVRFDVTVSGASIPAEVAVILKEKIRNFLLQGREGGIQLVDGKADTVMKCLISGYEPRVTRSNKREIGNKIQTITTYIGNAEASVHVLDPRGSPLDAAIVKHRLEDDFVVAQQEEKTSSVTDKKTSVWTRAKDATKVLTGSTAKTGPRLPTDQEWSARLIEGLAARVANRIVPVNEDFVVILPHDKSLGEGRDFVKAKRWGDAQEFLEKLDPLKGSSDAYRLYLLGISYEALAYQDADQLSKAPELLNKASEFYNQAAHLKPSERQFLLQQIRVRDSLDQYLAIQHFVSGRKSSSPETLGGAKSAGAGDTNASLIEMATAGMDESILVTFVRASKQPRFDSSAAGLMQLQKAKVPVKAIAAVQQVMRPASVAPRRSTKSAAAPH